MTKSILFTLVLAFALNGCAFSKSGRQQRAYEKYVRKSSMARVRQHRLFFRSDKPRMPEAPMPTEPIPSVESGPQAVPVES